MNVVLQARGVDATGIRRGKHVKRWWAKIVFAEGYRVSLFHVGRTALKLADVLPEAIQDVRWRVSPPIMERGIVANVQTRLIHGAIPTIRSASFH